MSSEPSLRDTFGTFLVEEGEKNKNIVVLDADLSTSTRTNKFAKKFPKRFFNMGIAEQNMLGTALGFAISGKIPVVSGFSIFTTGRAWEFIRFACHDRLNVKIITTHGGIVGEDGSTHNSLEDLSLMASLPNLTILVPSDNLELKKILEYVFKTDGTFYVRLPRASFPKIHNDDYNFNFGKPDVLKEGKDICLIGTGYGSILAFGSFLSIEKDLGISIKVINLPTIKPIDEKSLLNEIKEVKAIIVIEEHNIYCGFGSIIARIISKKYPKIIRSIGIDNQFVQSGERENVLNNYQLNKKELVRQINNILN
ncbi:MAG: transketolase family protein [Candidatus Odinarchaeota archaeon]